MNGARYIEISSGRQKMTQGLSILTGASAGATEAFVVVPFELVKIRLQGICEQVQPRKEWVLTEHTDKAQAAKYNGMIDCVQKIVRQEGLLTLYQGLESTIWRHVLWNAGYFGCIFQVRALLPENPTKDKSIQMRNDVMAGTVGGTVGTILNHAHGRGQEQNTELAKGARRCTEVQLGMACTWDSHEGRGIPRAVQGLHAQGAEIGPWWRYPTRGVYWCDGLLP